jgi:hypothetical protein
VRDHRRWLGVTATLGTAAAALAIAASAAALSSPTTRTRVFLESNNAPDISRAMCDAMGGCGPTVEAPVTLVSGQAYSIRVTGTVSPWSFYINPCGKPEPRPEFPTPGLVTMTAEDAQFLFASHLRGAGGRCHPMPFKRGMFQINLGSGWFHPIAVGNPSVPSGDQGRVQHPYRFRVIGQGARPRFRYVDNHPSDNNGAFKIVITPAPS